jgi:hypothetical protein
MLGKWMVLDGGFVVLCFGGLVFLVGHGYGELMHQDAGFGSLPKR